MCTAAKWLSLAAGLAACGGPARQCLVGADCVSGQCRADGSCVPPGSTAGGTSSGGAVASSSGSTGAAPGSGSTGGAGSSVGGSTGGSATGGSTGSPLCDDAFTGTITRAQVPVGPGLQATFAVAVDAGFDTTGQEVDGGIVWNLAGPFPGDHQELVQTEPLSSEWFGGGYPSASYAAVLTDMTPDLGVFVADSSSIDLQGVASPAQGASETELTYTPQVPVLSFPLQVGAAWQVDATVGGTYQGFPVIAGGWFDHYASSVDESGTVVLPSGASFPVLRVRTDLVNSFGAVVTTQRTFAFVTPCFGTIATIASQLLPGDQAGGPGDFQDPAEIRRLQAP